MIWVAGALWLGAASLAALPILIAAGDPRVFDSLGTEPGSGTALLLVVALVALGYATAGMLILRKRVRHAVGWLLLVSGPLISAVFSAATVGAALRLRGDPAAGWLVLYASYGWVPAVTLAGPVLALIFPDGKLPGPRWRAAVGVIAAVLIVALLTVLFAPGALGPEADAPVNPLAVGTLPEWAVALLEVSGLFLLLGMLAIAVAAVVTRFRRAGADERRQLKWFAFAVLVWAVLLPPSFFIETDEMFIIAMGALVLVPVSVVIAITRYRLYEIDTLINRTLVYIPLVGIVAGLYAACVALFQRLFLQFTGDTSDAAAVISALILAAVFTPMRKAIEGVVDRSFKPVVPGPPIGGDSVATSWNDQGFESAVERIVRRVLGEEGRGDDPVGGENPPRQEPAAPEDGENTLRV